MYQFKRDGKNVIELIMPFSHFSHE